ncbi:hypothetical protein X743_34305 [Mesorhizobium sp. LNHC252B00]|nr:hypothetical protein [Mesorhizobium sp. LNHC252B00]ESY62585.1 hypothetical protein X743_34305 [Mesorhizobium sp. LNHC252B00]
MPDGRIVVAALPDGVDGHFGLELRGAIVALLRDFGVSISMAILPD